MMENYSLVGCLVVAIGVLWKIQSAYYKKVEDERSKAIEKLQKKQEQMYNEEKERHSCESVALKDELKELHNERKTERKEWLNGLGKISKAVESVSLNMDQKFVTLEKDVAEIKEKLK